MTTSVPRKLIHHGESMQRLLGWVSGLLLLFFTFGIASWFSGAVCWLGFYLGARGEALASLAKTTTVVGFALGIAGTVAWYVRRYRSGEAAITPKAALLACLVLPMGNIFWAIFVDATAWHHGKDVVRPAFDYAMMFLVLGSVPPLALIVPCLVFHLRRRTTKRNANLAP